MLIPTAAVHFHQQSSDRSTGDSVRCYLEVGRLRKASAADTVMRVIGRRLMQARGRWPGVSYCCISINCGHWTIIYKTTVRGGGSLVIYVHRSAPASFFMSEQHAVNAKHWRLPAERNGFASDDTLRHSADRSNATRGRRLS